MAMAWSAPLFAALLLGLGLPGGVRGQGEVVGANTAPRNSIFNGYNLTDSDVYGIDSNGAFTINVTRMWEYFLDNGTLPLDWFPWMVNSSDGLDIAGALNLFNNDTFYDRFMEEVAPQLPQFQNWFDNLATNRESWLSDVNNGSSNNTGLIVGCVLGAVAILGIAAIAITFILVRKKRERARIQDEEKRAHKIDVFAFDDVDSIKSASSLAISAPRITDSGAVNTGDPVLNWISSRKSRSVISSIDISPTCAQGDDTGSLDGAGSVSRSSSDMPEFLSNLQFSWDEIHVVRSLGVGSFGKVFLAKWNETAVAVKVLLDAREISIGLDPSGSGVLSHASHVATPNPKRLIEEIKITAALRHPNVVQFMGFSLDPPSMAAEFCPRGSLYNVLHGNMNQQPDPSRKPISWLRRVAFAADAAAGMLHLHTRTPQIIHRDLKSPNLLVTADWTVKVADMGLSKLITDAALESGVNSIMTSGGGLNPRWLAPEVLSGDNCNVASDVYSFAMVMWEILTRRLPWEGKSPWSVVGDVQRGERPPIDLDTIEIDDQGTNREKDTSVMEYIEIMEACWKQNPDDRPDFAYVASKLRELQRNLIQKSC
jgi:hypothetical protein